MKQMIRIGMLAETMLREALGVRRKILGVKHPGVAASDR